MKPIEIHIEGYKIVIEEDKQPEVKDEKEDTVKEDTIKYVPYPVVPTIPTVEPNTSQPNDWWRYPYVTWTKDDVLSNINTTTTYPTPVRDAMVGKRVTDEDLG